MLRSLSFVSLALALATQLMAASSVVTMKTGERLIGKMDSSSDETTIVLQSLLLGELKLPRSQVAEIIETENSPDEVAAPEGQAQPEPQAASVEVLDLEQLPVLEQIRDLKAPDSWSGNLRIGMNFARGDSNWTETFFRGNVVIDPQQSRNFYRLSGSYTFRETERGTETVISTDRYDANFTYRRNFTESWFLQNFVGGRVDGVRGIDHEIQELIGVGYKFRPLEEMEIIVGGGGGVEDFEADFEDTRTGLNPVANVFQEFKWHPFEKATLSQEFNFFVNPDAAEQYNYVLIASFRYRITDLLGIEFSFDRNFDNDAGDGGSRDDTLWRNAIIVYF